MRLSLLLIFFAALAVASCSKEREEGRDKTGVWVRIENQSGVVLTSTSIDTLNYGDLIPGALTDYQLLKTPIYAGFCNFTINHERKSAGYGICGSPLPPPLEDGYYTFKVLAPDQGWFPLEVIR